MTKSAINLSLDIETVGLRPGSGIWQIGCIAIENPDWLFKATISPTEALKPPFSFEDATVRWQLEKNLENYDKAFYSFSQPDIRSMLLAFGDWYRNLAANHEIFLWTKGPHFDIAILDEAYSRFGLDAPWKYYSIRDMRTLQHLLPNVQVPKPAGLHDALVDAMYQGEVIKKCLENMQYLRGKDEQEW